VEQFSSALHSNFREFSIEHINFFSLKSLTALFSHYGMELDRQWKYKGIITAAFKKTLNSNENIIRYIQQCEISVSHMTSKIEIYVASKAPLLIWGAGTLTQYLLANTGLNVCNIVAIVDSNEHYHGKKLFEAEIISPDCLLDDKFQGLPIIISTYANNIQISNIIRDNLHLSNEIILL
jgi:hypothetical protein